MQYNFDQRINRIGTDCIKWDCKSAYLGAPADALPLWVADMDFSCPEPVLTALKKRVEHGIFGYSSPFASYYEAVINWFSQRHAWQLEKETIKVAPGVVPAIGLLLRALTAEGDGIVIQEPVYNPFRQIIEANGRTVVNNPLLYQPEGYVMDLDGLEACLAQKNVKMFLLCNPHNPVGRVWTQDELRAAGEICAKHGVWIVSDEIHCDIIRSGYAHFPMEKACPGYRERIISCLSPSKSFNLAGLIMANIIINDTAARQRFHEEATDKLHITTLSPLSIVATEAAYTQGGEWLDQMNAYVDGNVAFVKDFLAKELPGVRLSESQGTYLLWANFSAYFTQDEAMRTCIRDQARVALNTGITYGVGGEFFERINAACPRSVLEECFTRIAKAVREK